VRTATSRRAEYPAAVVAAAELEARRRGLPAARGGRGALASAWTPNANGQDQFFASDTLQVIATGDRGGGKTTLLLADFARDIGKGWGADWRGILFRQSYPQLDDAIVKSQALYHRAFPAARYNRSTHTWTWPGGEELLLRYIERPDDYWNYHGWQVPWLGFDELTTWPDLQCFDLVKSICRSARPGIPRRIRGSANPWGAGHNAVKIRFIDPDTGSQWEDRPPKGDLAEKLGIEIKPLPTRRIRVMLADNRPLLDADPDYQSRIAASAQSDGQLRAWLKEDWDVVAGGMFDDVWQRTRHVVAPFAIPPGWRLDRAFDWGSSKPYAVGWWAESDGTEATLADGSKQVYPRGTLFLIAERYGWTGEPNQGTRELATDVARKIVETERVSPLLSGRRVEHGPADPSIYAVQDGRSIAAEMETCGVKWTRADAGPGSRINGWELMRGRLKASLASPMESPGLFVFESCSQFLRTVPTLPRDGRKPDDVDTDAEDHMGDMSRYRCQGAVRSEITSSTLRW
jgi:hypothetical protein